MAFARQFRSSASRDCAGAPAAALYDAQMRLRSDIWVAAFLRRCGSENVPVFLRRRGSRGSRRHFRQDRPARRHGGAVCARAAKRGATEGVARLFARAHRDEWIEGAQVEAKLAKETGFDPDLWIVEVEDRAGTGDARRDLRASGLSLAVRRRRCSGGPKQARWRRNGPFAPRRRRRAGLFSAPRAKFAASGRPAPVIASTIREATRRGTDWNSAMARSNNSCDSAIRGKAIRKMRAATACGRPIATKASASASPRSSSTMRRARSELHCNRSASSKAKAARFC